MYKKEPYGYTVKVRPGSRLQPRMRGLSKELEVWYRGELLACDEERVYILLHDEGPGAYVSFRWIDLERGRIEVPSAAPLSLFFWWVIGGVSAISHGWFMMGTIPMWGVIGSILTLCSVPVFARSGMKLGELDPCEGLALYARYPAGLPDAMREEFVEGSERASWKLPAPMPAPWGGFGVFGSLVLVDLRESSFSVGDDWSAHVKQQGSTTGGIGLFGEYMLRPHFAAGVEAWVAFPRIVEGNRPHEEDLDVNGQMNAALRFLFRGKFPFRTDAGVCPYALVLAGYSMYHGGTVNHGVGLGTAAGAQYHLPAATPFVEARYMFHVGWYDRFVQQLEFDVDKEFLLYHSIAVNLGVRIP